MTDRNTNDAINVKTLVADTVPSDSDAAFGATIISLGVVYHPDVSRIGAAARIPFGKTGTIELSRMEPNFREMTGDSQLPLLDRHLSRTPIKIKRIDHRKFIFFPPVKNINVWVNGRELIEATSFDLDELGDEIIITLANTVILSLFNAPARQISRRTHSDFGLYGVSAGIASTRDAIRRVAKSDVPVLIRGETGTGKELVARGLHRRSARATREMISINMATIAPTLAAAELFGVRKGAFTGATQHSKGLFEQADGGILFLDEIGDTPKDVQPMLLRTLEFGEVRRVGDETFRTIDVRIIAATDRALELQKGEPSFNQPLLRRLEGISIDLPPLRVRRVDIGLLLHRFLSEANRDLPIRELTDLTAAEFSKLLLYDWPGNVRELKNIAQQFRLGQPILNERMVERARTKAADVAGVKGRYLSYTDPKMITDEALIEALDKCNWIIKDAANKLNISRTSMYDIMTKSNEVRVVQNISETELRNAMETTGGDLNGLAKKLRVGRNSLKKRVATLTEANGK